MKYRLNTKKLKVLMIEKDINSLVELSEKTGLSRTTIYDYINGNSPFSKSFITLCDFFESLPEELIIEDTEELSNES